jgi:tetratricopeptide (TPR) repeat protein
VGRPEGDWDRIDAMTQLGNGLAGADHHEAALSVREADFSMKRRKGASETNTLAIQGNLANTYDKLGRREEALRMRRDVYSGRLKLSGDEDLSTLIAANNYALSLNDLKRFEETRALLRKTMPVARRVLGESHEIMLWMRRSYAVALHKDPAATLDDLREAVTTLEDAERIARRVLGGAHPRTVDLEDELRGARAVLRETTPAPPSSESV